jgi:hypothetical protein
MQKTHYSWGMASLQVMALMGFVIDRQEREPAIESFLQQPTAASMGGTLGYLIGINILPIVTLIAGLTLWRHGKSTESKTIISAATIAIIIGSILIFW